MKWISVNDEMPKVGEDVLVYRINKKISVAHCSNSGSWYYEQDEYEVTHWMQLPEDLEELWKAHKKNN